MFFGFICSSRNTLAAARRSHRWIQFIPSISHLWAYKIQKYIYIYIMMCIYIYIMMCIYIYIYMVYQVANQMYLANLQPCPRILMILGCLMFSQLFFSQPWLLWPGLVANIWNNRQCDHGCQRNRQSNLKCMYDTLYFMIIILRQNPEVCPDSQRASGQAKMMMMMMMKKKKKMMMMMMLMFLILKPY